MTLKQRRIYFLIFLLIFIVAVPILAFYSLGYRLDTDKFALVKTGGIFINADPRGVDIYVDGELKKKTSTMPFAQGKLVSGLLPGKHLIEVKKQNYSDWQKNLEVASNLVTEARNIFLPKAGAKPEMISENAKDFIFSSSHALIAYAVKNEIKLADVSSKEKAPASFKFSDGENIKKMNFSPDEKFILAETELKNKNKFYVIDISSSEIKEILKNSPEKYVKITWYPSDLDKLIALTNKNILYSLNINVQNEQILLAKNTGNFAVFGDLIIYSTTLPTVLYEKNTKSDATIQLTKTPIENFDLSSEIFRSKGGEIVILNNKKELLLYNYETQEFTSLANNVSYAIFSPDGKKLLFRNRNEIYIYYLRDIRIQPYKNAGETELITRFSKPVKNSEWFEYNNEYIMLGAENNIKLIELDNRDKRNTYEIAEAKESIKIKYNNYDDYIYFLDGSELKKITLLEGNL